MKKNKKCSIIISIVIMLGLALSSCTRIKYETLEYGSVRLKFPKVTERIEYDTEQTGDVLEILIYASGGKQICNITIDYKPNYDATNEEHLASSEQQAIIYDDSIVMIENGEFTFKGIDNINGLDVLRADYTVRNYTKTAFSFVYNGAYYLFSLSITGNNEGLKYEILNSIEFQ